MAGVFVSDELIPETMYRVFDVNCIFYHAVVATARTFTLSCTVYGVKGGNIQWFMFFEDPLEKNTVKGTLFLSSKRVMRKD